MRESNGVSGVQVHVEGVNTSSEGDTRVDGEDNQISNKDTWRKGRVII